MAKGEFLKCAKCSGELGLRERYERLLDLLQAGIVVYHANNEFEKNQQDRINAENVMTASVQLYNILGTYWEDIPGDTIQEKLESIESKRQYDRDENGKVIPKEKETEGGIILQ
jgi:hypothetical protein